MNILMSGASGLLGSALAGRLLAAGDDVVRLVRSDPASPDERKWQPRQGILNARDVAGFDVVVHLSGENIGGRRWTADQKRRIVDSRVDSTALLVDRLLASGSPPGLFIGASAIGYYGHRPDEVLTEDSSVGDGFLAETCAQWEAAADPAREAGLRVVHMRTGPVLSAKGGALARLLTPFRLGLGGVVGSGGQYMSWIGVDDTVGAFEHVVRSSDLSGALVVASPRPATNRVFTKTLGYVLGRPTILPLPAFAARLALGEMADELLLVSQRASSRRLERSGFVFRFPELESALRRAIDDDV